MIWFKKNLLSSLWIICFILLVIVAGLQSNNQYSENSNGFHIALAVFLCYLAFITLFTPIIGIRRYLRKIKEQPYMRITLNEMLPFILCWSVAIAIFIFFISHHNQFIARTAGFIAISYSASMGTKLSLKKQKAALLNQIEVQLRKLNSSNLSHKLNNVRIYLSLKFENLATNLTTVQTAKEIKNNAALINQFTTIVNLIGQEPTPLVNHNYQFAVNESLLLQLTPLTNFSISGDTKKSKLSNFIKFFRKDNVMAQTIPRNEILITNYRIINTDIKNSFVLNKKQITNIYYDLQLNSLNIETTPTRHYALELNQQDLLKTLITLDYLKFI